MCLAIPARVTELLDLDMAKVEVGGIVKTISLCLVDDVSIGDYVILHVGFALSKLEPDEARQTLALFAEAGVLEGLSEELAGDPIEDPPR